MFDESFATAWHARYGTPPPALDDAVAATLAPFLTHRSVREFDTERPIPEALVRGLVAAGQSAATSSNLQLYSLVSIQEPARRERIAELCAGQQQIRDAAWVFAVCIDHHRLRAAAEAAGQAPTGLAYTEYLLMAAVDAALAAERMATAAERLGIGICYIGALRNDAPAVAELLALPDGVFGLFGFCLGYPSATCTAEIKPRLAQEAVWFRERYDPQPDTAEYDERMRAHYQRRGQNPDVTWAMRSGRRTDDQHLSGRHILGPWLEERGIARR
jgi:nitroreductase